MWSIFSRGAFSSLPFELQEVISDDSRMIWKLHKGKLKQNGEEVSIFVCDSSSNVLDLARGAIKRLKMLKHPSILKYIDSVETDKIVYLVTEPVVPLLQYIQDNNITKSNTTLAAWGLLQITKGLKFLNIDGKLLHNNISESSIFVTLGGEWKISGLEYASADLHFIPSKAIPALQCYSPPERLKQGKPGHIWSADMWGLGCLIWETFNGQLHSSSSLQETSKIPNKLLAVLKELIKNIPSQRPNPSHLLDRLQKPGQFYSNDLIQVLSVLEEIHIKEEAEKQRFFSGLTDKLDNIPPYIAKNKILPALLSAHEFSCSGSVLLTPLFKIGNLLDDSEYQKLIVPCIVRLFSSTDRTTRLKLLQQMESMVKHLNPKTINDQIFNSLVSGFQDTNPTIREQTIKAIIHLAPKLNYNNLNVELLKHLAKLQSKDEQGGIRTNSTVCLGRIAPYLHPSTRQKCLISAFTRAIRDPFPASRAAGATAVAATEKFYPVNDIATKIVPTLSQLTVDPDKCVRDIVFRVLKGFIGKLEKLSEDPTLIEEMEKEVSSAGASTASHTWTGWAAGALTSTFYTHLKGSKEKAESSQKQEEISAPSTRTSSISSFTSEKSKTRISEPLNDSPPNEFAFDDVADGWGDDDNVDAWGALEDEAEIEEKHKSTNLLEEKFETDDFFSNFENKAPKHSQKEAKQDTWGTWEGESEPVLPVKSNYDAKKEREERKLQRQKEIQAKRAAKGPMKLGAKK